MKNETLLYTNNEAFAPKRFKLDRERTKKQFSSLLKKTRSSRERKRIERLRDKVMAGTLTKTDAIIGSLDLMLGFNASEAH